MLIRQQMQIAWSITSMWYVSMSKKLSVTETIKLIDDAGQWAGTTEIKLLGGIGDNQALKVKAEIKQKMYNEGKVCRSNFVPMEYVLEYFDINLDYLYRVKERKIVNG